MTNADDPAATSRMPGFLLAWDRLWFRVLVFAGLASMWVLQGMLGGVPWRDLALTEFGGLLPWVFLAPLVLRLNARIRSTSPGPGRYLALHVGGALLVYVPYWLSLRVIGFSWRWLTIGWTPQTLASLTPTTMNVVGGLLNVPFVYFLILVGAEAMANAKGRQEEAAQAERLGRQLSDARLALLQRQLHPHFLFNALQAISTLVHRDAATADRLIVCLADLLRAMLDGASAQTLTLRTELELVRKYLEIEQVRFGQRLSIDWHVDDATLDLSIPSLSVLPLVENAIRHGLAPKVGEGRLTITANVEAEALRLAVEDDGLGADLPLTSGLGVSNTRERLAALYGPRAALEIDTQPGRGFRATVRIPVGQEPS